MVLVITIYQSFNCPLRVGCFAESKARERISMRSVHKYVSFVILGATQFPVKQPSLSGLFLRHFRTLGHGFFNTTDHVERLLGQVIVIAIDDALEGADGVFQRYVLAG